MENKQNRYMTMERNMCLVLAVDLILFIGYLIAAGNGIIWLKVILFILTISLAVLCLVFLYLTGEIGKQRSLWLVTASAAIAVCVLFSLILNFPSPNPYNQTDKQQTNISAEK
jgi:cytochrome bd-type quinol oxidase subunit 2